MQPADVLAADVFAAVAGTLVAHQFGLDAGGFDQQLLTAAALKCDEPERCGFDAVTAGGKQAVVLVDGGPSLSAWCIPAHLRLASVRHRSAGLDGEAIRVDTG